MYAFRSDSRERSPRGRSSGRSSRGRSHNEAREGRRKARDDEWEYEREGREKRYRESSSNRRGRSASRSFFRPSPSSTHHDDRVDRTHTASGNHGPTALRPVKDFRPRVRIERHENRREAVLFLMSWDDKKPHTIPEVDAAIDEFMRKLPKEPEYYIFTEELLSGMVPNLVYCDRWIMSILDESLQKSLTTSELSIMRTAAFELLNHQHIPTTVVINEANSLAKEFCPRSQTLVHASVNRMIETQYSVGHQLREAMVAGDLRNASKPSSPMGSDGHGDSNGQQQQAPFGIQACSAKQLNSMDPATQLALLLIEKERKKKEKKDKKRKSRKRRHRHRSSSSRSYSDDSRSRSRSYDHSRNTTPQQVDMLRPSNFANMVPPNHPDYRPARIEYQPIDPSQHVQTRAASPESLSGAGTPSVESGGGGIDGGGGIINPPLTSQNVYGHEDAVDPNDFVKAGQRAAAMLMNQGVGKSKQQTPLVSGTIKTIPQRRVELCNATTQTISRPDLDKDAVIWRLRQRCSG